MSKAVPHVSQFMTACPITVERTMTLAGAASLMKEHGIRHLPVMAGNKLLGVITERDIALACSFELVEPKKVSVYGAMAEELYTVEPDAPIDEVVATMGQRRLGSAIVLGDERILGIFTTVDVCRAFSELIGASLGR